MVWVIDMETKTAPTLNAWSTSKRHKVINPQITKRPKVENIKLRVGVNRTAVGKLLTALFEGIYDYCVSGTLHGLRHVVQKGRPLREKLLWAAVLLACFIACDMNISSLYFKWISSPFVIVLDNVYSGIWEIPFPGVVICPFMRIKRSYLDLSEAPTKLQTFLASMICEEVRTHENLLEKPLTDAEMDYLHQFFGNASLDCTDFIKRCSWQSVSSLNIGLSLSSEECCRDLFHPVIMSDGYCQAFNLMPNNGLTSGFVPWLTRIGYSVSDAEKQRFQYLWSPDEGFSSMELSKQYPRRAMVTGPGYGLMVELYFNYSEWQPKCNSGYKGFRLTITSQSKDAEGQSYVDIPMNQQTTINIAPTTTTTIDNMRKISSDTRKCYFQDENPLRTYQIYSDHNCKREWLYKNMFVRCGCVPFQAPLIMLNESAKICSTKENVDCMLQTESEVYKEVMQLYTDQKKEYINFKSDKISALKRNTPNCWPGCNFISYSKSVYYSDYIRTNSNSAEPGWETEPAADGELTSVTVRYEDEFFLGFHREAQYDLLELIASIGGVFSLFLGFSLMSLIEFIYYVIIRPIFAVLQAPLRRLRLEPRPILQYLP